MNQPIANSGKGKTYNGCFILSLSKISADKNYLEQLKRQLANEHEDFTDFVLAVNYKGEYQAL